MIHEHQDVAKQGKKHATSTGRTVVQNASRMQLVSGRACRQPMADVVCGELALQVTRDTLDCWRLPAVLWSTPSPANPTLGDNTHIEHMHTRGDNTPQHQQTQPSVTAHP